MLIIWSFGAFFVSLIPYKYNRASYAPARYDEIKDFV